MQHYPRRAATLGLMFLAGVLLACDNDGVRVQAITATPAGGASTAAAPRTATPAATAAGLPPRPEHPFASGRTVEAYLAGGEADIEGCLPELVESWGLAAEVEGPRCLGVDFEGEGAEEWVFLISFDGSDGPREADLWFFDDEDARYRYFNSGRAMANAITAAWEIRAVEDLTQDGLADLVATWEECGASTCTTSVVVVSQHDGTLENLAPGDTSVETLEAFEIVDGEVRMRGGGAESVGAGPQRETLVMVAWSGLRFRAERQPGEPVYLVHLVNDADRAFEEGDYALARSLYEQAAADDALADWKAEIGQAPGRPELQAYSLLRAGIAAERQGARDGALALAARATVDYRGTMHGSAAGEYGQVLADGGLPEEACAAAEDMLDTFQPRYQQFWDFGHANPQREIYLLCG